MTNARHPLNANKESSDYQYSSQAIVYSDQPQELMLNKQQFVQVFVKEMLATISQGIFAEPRWASLIAHNLKTGRESDARNYFSAKIILELYNITKKQKITSDVSVVETIKTLIQKGKLPKNYLESSDIVNLAQKEIIDEIKKTTSAPTQTSSFWILQEQFTKQVEAFAAKEAMIFVWSLLSEADVRNSIRSNIDSGEGYMKSLIQSEIIKTQMGDEKEKTENHFHDETCTAEHNQENKEKDSNNENKDKDLKNDNNDKGNKDKDLKNDNNDKGNEDKDLKNDNNDKGNEDKDLKNDNNDKGNEDQPSQYVQGDQGIVNDQEVLSGEIFSTNKYIKKYIAELSRHSEGSLFGLIKYATKEDFQNDWQRLFFVQTSSMEKFKTKEDAKKAIIAKMMEDFGPGGAVLFKVGDKNGDNSIDLNEHKSKYYAIYTGEAYNIQEEIDDLVESITSGIFATDNNPV